MRRGSVIFCPLFQPCRHQVFIRFASVGSKKASSGIELAWGKE
jgi:hypothetical protein